MNPGSRRDFTLTLALSHQGRGKSGAVPSAAAPGGSSRRGERHLRQRTKTQRGLEERRTGQDYLDGWVLDYNFFKDHEAHKGEQPADAAGVSAQVPWDSWEDITRIGGEVAKTRLVSHTAVPKKPGPKPQIGGVQEAVRAYMEGLAAGKAHARTRQAEGSGDCLSRQE